MALRTADRAARWAGGLVVAVVVLLNVLSGGMRSITFVQAFQYWLKLTALFVPVVFLVIVWLGDGGQSPADPSLVVDGESGTAWANPVDFAGGHPLYSTYSLMVATFLGTMGLPHVVVRFYTNPDGQAARQTTVAVLALLGLFYVLPPVYAALGRLYAPDLVGSGRADSVVLELPSQDDRRSRRRPAHRAADGRRVRGVPGDLVRADHRRRRRHHPGRDEQAARGRHRLPGLRRRRRRRTVPARAGHPRRRRRDGRRAWPSRWRPPRSARCWCWGSGGAGSPTSARSPDCSSAACSPAAPWSTTWSPTAPAAGSPRWSPSPRPGRSRSRSRR